MKNGLQYPQTLILTLLNSDRNDAHLFIAMCTHDYQLGFLKSPCLGVDISCIMQTHD